MQTERDTKETNEERERKWTTLKTFIGKSSWQRTPSFQGDSKGKPKKRKDLKNEQKANFH